VSEQERLSAEAASFRALVSSGGPAVVGDVEGFLGSVCRLKLFAYQLEFARLYRESKFLAVRWPRQTGKSNVDRGFAFAGCG
jgi:hypothetical protein